MTLSNLTISKKYILELLESVQGVQEFVSISRNGDIIETARKFLEIRTAVKQKIQHYARAELVQVCQQCNTRQLLGFWVWYSNWLKCAVNQGLVAGDFAVFGLVAEAGQNDLRLEPIQIEWFERYFYWVVDAEKGRFGYCAMKDKQKHVEEFREYAHSPIEQIIPRLYLLKSKYENSVRYLYNTFLLEEKQRNSSYWGDYKAHVILDYFLYSDKEGAYNGAVFDKIFFATNLKELEVYIYYCRDSDIALSYSAIRQFLDRQVKYYMRLGLGISQAENAFLNNQKHLLYYDADQGVVCMPELSRTLKEKINNEMDRVGIVKGAGCPFIKSKGVEHSAAAEVYTYFNNLMLVLAERWLSGKDSTNGKAR